MRPELPPAVFTAPPAGWRVWWTAIRPRTLSIAATPVIVGTALALAEGAAANWLAMLAALCCALLIQAGTNLHNDAADFERGTDQPDRIGPLRVTAAGWASPAAVRRAAAISFALALLLGVYLVAIGGWPILAAGVASLLAGWSYSGGRHPVSHTPLGELFVLVFFGLVAVAGSHWLQTGAWSPRAWLAGIVVGMPAAAVLLVNNYRDLEQDSRAGRRTLAVLLGRTRARRVYFALMMMPFPVMLGLALYGRPGAALGLLALPFCVLLCRRLAITVPGPELNLLLAATARAGFATATLLALGLLLF
ncbi:MAG: 1,4-dihydroxy-2-naphthoate polyprenyltransferase [Betaproteobacteria bacterium]|nr:1,4-dihydroxy-2-naphthoate polyprenyltransferase [Betaproteobacteria bacterium]